MVQHRVLVQARQLRKHRAHRTAAAVFAPSATGGEAVGRDGAAPGAAVVGVFVVAVERATGTEAVLARQEELWVDGL